MPADFCNPMVAKPKSHEPGILRIETFYGQEFREGYMTDGGDWYAPNVGSKPVNVSGWMYCRKWM